MDSEQVIKSSQEQAVAAWINFLNQMRLNELLAKLSAQDINLAAALAELQNMKLDIAGLIETNRGGGKGIHGFIAEAAETGIENARNLVHGMDAICQWINNNGPADLQRAGVDIQQKFVSAGGHFGLEKVKEHLETYPDFLKNGGKYQIPKDFYEKVVKLLAMSEKEAGKLTSNDPDGLTYSLWKWVHDFFDNGRIKPEDIEPSRLQYSEAQRSQIDKTIKREEKNIKKEDQKCRNEAYEASKPSVKQGAQVAAVAAAAEGGMYFCLGVHKKLKSGKRLHDFTAEDWKDVGIDTAKGTAAGGFRGVSVYAMTNFTATPAAVANSLVTAMLGMMAQASQLRQGNISSEDFIVNSEVICLDASVSAAASILGQVAIPVPVLGAVIGNTVGMFMYGIAKDRFSKQEQTLIDDFKDGIEKLNGRLDAQYQALIEHLREEFRKYSSILELAFDLDVNIAFDGSIALADYVGVPIGSTLRSKTDIDNYFMN